MRLPSACLFASPAPVVAPSNENPIKGKISVNDKWRLISIVRVNIDVLTSLSRLSSRSGCKSGLSVRRTERKTRTHSLGGFEI